MNKPKKIPAIRVPKNQIELTREIDVVIADRFPDTPHEKGRTADPGVAGSVPAWHCQVALALTQAAFCVGSVYLKSTLRLVDGAKGQSFHPIIYAFLREVVAAPIMCTIAYLSTGALPKRKDLAQVGVLGVCLYLNQLFFILGIDLSGVVVATCMQPTLPVFTALLAVMFGMETGSLQKFVGIGLAVGGSICMVLGGASDQHLSPAKSHDMVVGNLCLLANTLAMAFYFLAAKQLVMRYPPICIAAWAYVSAALLMGSTAATFVDRSGWDMPPVLLGPLIYWILICSVCGYYVVTWATQHLPASQVASFQCLQPFLGTVLAYFFLGEEPTIWDLGAVGILVGLLLVSRDKQDKVKSSAILGRIARLMSQQSLQGIARTATKE